MTCLTACSPASLNVSADLREFIIQLYDLGNERSALINNECLSACVCVCMGGAYCFQAL